MQPLQHPPHLPPILLVKPVIRDIGVRLSAPVGIDPASEVALEFLDFGLEAGAALPAGEIDVKAGAGSGAVAVLGLELGFVEFAVAD